MKKYSVTIRGHRTSYSLEEEFQAELIKIAAEKNISLAKLITSIDVKRDGKPNLSSQLRLYILNHIKTR